MAEQSKHNDSAFIWTSAGSLVSLVLAIVVCMSIWEGAGRYSDMANGITIAYALAFLLGVNVLLASILFFRGAKLLHYFALTPSVAPILIALAMIIPELVEEYPSCSIEYQNESGMQIWVENVGNLSPRGSAGIGGVKPKQLATSREIVWWQGDRQKPSDESEVSRQIVAQPDNLPNHHDLIFTFDESRNWSAKLKRREVR